jgi:AcrR family transcriptional regulator
LNTGQQRDVATRGAGRRAKGRAREAALARAAADAIAELGLANVRVTDVAQRAGVAPGHVTYYFHSKDELLMRAVRQIEDEDLEQMRNEIHVIADPWERVMRLAELVLAKGQGDSDWVVWFDVWSKAVRDELVAVQGAQMEASWRAEMTDAIQSGMERGVFLAADANAAALLITSLITGLSIRLTLGSGNLRREDVLPILRAAITTLLTAGQQA